MMLAKLSFISRRTISSMVTTPASSSGMSVSNTSPKRRSTIHSRMVIEASAQKPASMNARTTVRPDSRIETGPPMPLGSTACTARANSRKVSLSLGSPLGRISTLKRPSLVTHSLAISGGSVSSVTGCAGSKLAEIAGEPLGGGGTGAALRARCLLEAIDGGLERGDVVGIGRRLLVRVGLEHRIEHGGELSDGGELGLLVGRDEALDGPHQGDLGQLAELLHAGVRRVLVLLEQVDRVGPDCGIALELEEGRNRLDLGAAQVERVEIELHPVEQRQAGGDHQRGADDDRNAAAFHEAFDRSERLETHFFRLARRAQQCQ